MKLEIDLDNVSAYDGESVASLIRDEIAIVIRTEIRRAAKEQQRKIATLCSGAVRALVTPDMVASVMAQLKAKG